MIGGYTPPQGSRKVLGALLMGYLGDGGLRYAGKVGTGFDQAPWPTSANGWPRWCGTGRRSPSA